MAQKPVLRPAWLVTGVALGMAASGAALWLTDAQRLATERVGMALFAAALLLYAVQLVIKIIRRP